MVVVGTVLEPETSHHLRGVQRSTDTARIATTELNKLFKDRRFVANPSPFSKTEIVKGEITVGSEKLNIHAYYDNGTNEVFVKVRRRDDSLDVVAKFKNIAIYLTKGRKTIGLGKTFGYIADSRGLHTKITCPERTTYGLRAVAEV